MTIIKKLKLKLKSGLLSELQSDTIFGHFAWRFKEQHGDEKLEEFLDLFVDGNPVFTISDGLLEKNGEVFFPKPLKLTPPEFESKNKKERIKNFIKQKESKSLKLITVEQLNYFLNAQLDEFDKSLTQSNSKDYPKFEQDLRVHVEIDRETFSSKKKKLFTENPKYLDKDTSLVVFVKILNQTKWDELYCENILKNVFEIGYGKKKSSGYGHFEILSFEDYTKFKEPKESNGFISLSQYLPANSDNIKDAFYDINVKYGKFGEEKSSSQNPFKPAMLLMKPGSCFVTDKQTEFYGRAIKGFVDYQPKLIHNGIAFTLAAKL